MVYTDDQRADALRLYEEHGAAGACRLLDYAVSPATVRVWAHRAGLKRYTSEKTAEATAAHQLRQAEMREELRELFLSKAMDMLLRMDEPHLDYRGKDASPVTWEKAPARECQAYMTAAATALDKFRLEMGEATSRSELTDASKIDLELARTVEEWRIQTNADRD